MLKFTKDQMNLILNARKQFNAGQDSLAHKHGLPTDVTGLNTNTMIGNASHLPKDAWGVWDKEFIQIQRDVLSVFNDIAATNSMAMPIGKLVHHFATMSDSGGVNVSMDGQSNAKSDSATINYHGTPVPIIDSTLRLEWRQVAAAQSDGVQLDTAMAGNHQRRLAEKLEDMIINGEPKAVVGGDQVYGLTNHPKRNTRSTGVTLNGATGANWIAEVKGVIETLHNANFYTPAVLYMNYSDWFYASITDYSTQYGDKTILQRVMEIAGVEKIVPASRVPANTILGVCKRRDVIQILSAMPPSMRPKTRLDQEDPYLFYFMAAAAPEIRFDANDQCGIVHSS